MLDDAKQPNEARQGTGTRPLSAPRPPEHPPKPSQDGQIAKNPEHHVLLCAAVRVQQRMAVALDPGPGPGRGLLRERRAGGRGRGEAGEGPNHLEDQCVRQTRASMPAIQAVSVSKPLYHAECCPSRGKPGPPAVQAGRRRLLMAKPLRGRAGSLAMSIRRSCSGTS